MSWSSGCGGGEVAIFNDVINGDRAFTTQSYDEINKKRGLQWEASRIVTLANEAVTTAVLTTGALPVDLKKREFAYRKAGIVARIYKAPTYTGGTPLTMYNMNTVKAVDTPLSQLVVDVTVTDNGVECGAPVYAIGPDTNQTTGASNIPYATNRILEPNTAYLLTIESLDTTQDITARIEFYEGVLDVEVDT